MAAEFLASHGIDLSAVLAQARAGSAEQPYVSPTPPVTRILNARLPGRPSHETYDITLSSSRVASIEPHDSAAQLPATNLPAILDARGGLLAPQLCHAHVHLDKCFLLSDADYADLQIDSGDFAEAMRLTNDAKRRFTQDSLIRRGRRLLRRSLAAGTTAVRAFVEVDELVGLACVRAAEQLKAEFAGQGCQVQVVAFAQLALISGSDAAQRRELLEEALALDAVDVVGTTPYVEDDRETAERNVAYAIDLAVKYGKHLDFHLDYNLDASTEPMIWHVLSQLRTKWIGKAAEGKTVCVGHATRLTLFSDAEWAKLREAVDGLPVYFVGLPTSDLFMMGREEQRYGQRVRGTLPVPALVKQGGLRCAISVNNVGNAFTPQGGCDPLGVASFGVGVYQAATKEDIEVLYECVSCRAREAIGLQAPGQGGLEITEGCPAGFLLLNWSDEEMVGEPLSVAHAVYDPTSVTRKLVR